MTTEPKKRSISFGSIDPQHQLRYMIFWSRKLNKNFLLCLSILLPVSLVSFRVKNTVAQDFPSLSEKLPSPSAIASGDPSQLQSLPFARSKYREYIFKKPDFSNTKSDRLYLVEVYGNSDLILYQVKQIEPQAFRKGGFIQVGKFRKQESANKSIQQLAQSGLRSRITIVSGS